MSDIVDRLREQGEWRNDKAWDGCPIAEEAADEITRLREENACLREALKPFARAAEYCKGLGDLDHKSVLVGNFRAAATAIREGGKDDVS